jgi:hypothetical protein
MRALHHPSFVPAALAWVLVGAIALAPEAASAQRRGRAPESVAKTIARATDFLNEGDFERALELLDGAVPRAKGGKELARVHFLRGQSFDGLGDEKRAQEALTMAFEQDPKLAIDTQLLSPRMADNVAKARSRIPGELTVRASEPGATVRIDGEPLGPAPLVMRMSPGPHKVEVQSEDRKRVGKSEVNLEPGEVRELTLTLLEMPPEPVVKAPPAGSRPGDAQTATPAATAVTARQGRSMLVPKLLVGGGVAALAIGLVGSGAARNVHTEYSRQQSLTTQEPTVSRAKASGAQTLNTVSWLLAVGGLATAGYGGYQLWRGSSAAAMALPQPLPGGAGVAVAGRF